MDDFIAYLDTSEVRPGKLEVLKTAVVELAVFVEFYQDRRGCQIATDRKQQEGVPAAGSIRYCQLAGRLPGYFGT